MSKTMENFALTNPISAITGKESKDFTREDMIKVISDKGIERITFHYTGNDGKIKDLRIPIENRRNAELVLSEGERVDGSSLFKGMVDTGKSDLYVVPFYKSAFLNPFDEKSLDFVCRFLTPQGELAPFAPDNILAKASNMIRDKFDIDLYALGELEFFLMSQIENNSFPLPKQRGYHASAPFVKGGEVLNEMLRHIASICGHVKYAHTEVGYINKVESELEEINGKQAEQFEIEFNPTPIEDMADILVLSRWIIRNVAYRRNCVATFVPKLEIGHAGSGMHVHMALMKDGKNIMLDSKGALSDKAKKVIGGLCRYAPSLTAFGNMVSAAYLRLVPNQEAPTKVCWSEMNRSAMIRVPLGWSTINNLGAKINPQQKTLLKDIPGRQTVELRSPDGSTNTHMLMAGISLAVEWGLSNPKEALELAKNGHVTANIHTNDEYQNLPELARSCVESSEKLLAERKIYEREDIFPPRVIDFVAEQLKNENDRDLDARLMALPDDEKNKEARRVMHRDIHKN